MSDDGKVVQLYTSVKESVDAVIDSAIVIAEEEELECMMVVAVSKSKAGRFHILSSNPSLLQKYALAGMVQSWATEHSIQSGGWDEQ